MFYSHEVLTSRQYGVATVWLVATLGAKSHSKKINRKAIQEVDVPKACQTIIDPTAPMALRLQGNLLYGVSRVFVQQCGYVLSDAQSAYNTMHLMLRAVKSAALDPNAGKARPEQLILQDDPSFLPEFALPPPELLVELNLGPPLNPPLRNGDSQTWTPSGSQQDPSTPAGAIGGLILPTSSSVGVGGFQLQGDNGTSSVGGLGSVPGAKDLNERMDDPEFTFDEDGNMIDFEEVNAISRTPMAPRGASMPSDAGGSARVRQEHDEGRRAGIEQLEGMELDLPIFGDELPEGDAFPTAHQQRLDQSLATVESDSPVAAPNRRKTRAPRRLPLDTTMELRNQDLADWNTNYLQNMQEATRQKNQARLAQLAKKNAEYWVWGAGIGGIGARMPDATGPTPFDRFIGDKFFELFTGINRKDAAGKKRDRDSGIDEATQGESRHVRQKTTELGEEMGRGEEDEGMFIPQDDEVELPRQAPAGLDDQQMFSAMPWNITASIRGSSAVPRSVRIGATGSLTGAPTRRGSRMISTSPLKGRGQHGELEELEDLDEGEDHVGSSGADFSFAGPGLSSDVSEAAFAEPNVRVREALSAEGENFLSFVVEAIDKKRERVRAGLEPMSDVLQVDAAADVDEVSFEELLPPVENSKVVASQALLHVLTLGSKGLLDVRQYGDYEEIGISLTEKSKVAQIEVPEEDGNEDVVGGEEDDEEGGHFEEMYAAGRGWSEEVDDNDNNNDSLYAD